MPKSNRMSTNKVLRIVFSILLIFVGAVLILLGVTGRVGNLLANIGLALIVGIYIEAVDGLVFFGT